MSHIKIKTAKTANGNIGFLIGIYDDTSGAEYRSYVAEDVSAAEEIILDLLRQVASGCPIYQLGAEQETPTT